MKYPVLDRGIAEGVFGRAVSRETPPVEARSECEVGSEVAFCSC